MKTVYYPPIKGAESIKGWVSAEKTIIDLAPSGSVDVEDSVADQIASVYSFLKTYESDKPVIKPKTDVNKMTWAEMVKIGKELGVYNISMKKADVMEAIKLKLSNR